MKVTGKRTYSEDVEVEISAATIVKCILELYDKKYPRPGNDCYINSKGKWMKYDYTHPHNGDDIYSTLRLATEEELEQDRIRKIIQGLI